VTQGREGHSKKGKGPTNIILDMRIEKGYLSSCRGKRWKGGMGNHYEKGGGKVPKLSNAKRLRQFGGKFFGAN